MRCWLTKRRNITLVAHAFLTSLVFLLGAGEIELATRTFCLANGLPSASLVGALAGQAALQTVVFSSSRAIETAGKRINPSRGQGAARITVLTVLWVTFIRVCLTFLTGATVPFPRIAAALAVAFTAVAVGRQRIGGLPDGGELGPARAARHSTPSPER